MTPPKPQPEEEDDDFLEHDDRLQPWAEDPLTSDLRPLFPDGDPSKAEEWKELFDV